MSQNSQKKKTLLIIDEDSYGEHYLSYEDSLQNQRIDYEVQFHQSSQLDYQRKMKKQQQNAIDSYPKNIKEKSNQLFRMDYLKNFHYDQDDIDDQEYSSGGEYYQLQNLRQRMRKKKKRNKSNKHELSKEEIIQIRNFMKRTTYSFFDKQAEAKQIKQQIHGIPVYFPYQPYNLQINYMKHVIEALKGCQNALLESPTGTGKTLCLLASTLSWIYSQKLKGNHKKVIYLSRTHSQLQQIQKQLKKTCFRPTMSYVGSRDHLCIKQEFKNLKSRQLMQECSKGVKLKLKNNAGLIKWDKMTKQEAYQKQKTMCNYYSDRQETINIGTSLYANKILQIEEIRQQGKNSHFCPYYYPYYMDNYCDLFMMPYNYILDVDLLPRFKQMIEGAILIFDEAHNVPEASCEGRSYELNCSNIKGGIAQIQKTLFAKKISPSLRAIRKVFRARLDDLLGFFENLDTTLLSFMKDIPFLDPPSNAEKRYIGDDQSQRIKIFTHQNLQLALYQMAMGKIINATDKYILQQKGDYFQKQIKRMVLQISMKCSQIDDLTQQIKQTEDGIFHNMEKISTFWKRVVQLISDSFNSDKKFIENEINHYRLVLRVTLEQQCLNYSDQIMIKDYTVQLRCLVPWLTFQKIVSMGPRSIIFTSGTLSPLQSWQSELKIQAPIKLENKHIITERQVRLNILKSNIMGNIFDFRYQSIKQDPQIIYNQLLETIFQISKLVPHGMLVICPNFKTLRELKYRVGLRNNAIRMNKVKAQIFEQRGDEKYINQFKDQSQNGAILYCVCRGRASQGIDFPDNHCRAVVFVGIPFPNISDPMLIEKKQHFQKLDRMRKIGKQSIPGLNWDKWYFNGTIRAINQGLGRLIRHSKDYGMLFLLDERYSQSRFRKALPEWAQMGISIWDETTSQRLQNISKFYMNNAQYFQNSTNVCQKQREKDQSNQKTYLQQIKTMRKKEINPGLLQLLQKHIQSYRDQASQSNEKSAKDRKDSFQSENRKASQQKRKAKHVRRLIQGKKFVNNKNSLDYYFSKKTQQKKSSQ